MSQLRCWCLKRPFICEEKGYQSGVQVLYPHQHHSHCLDFSALCWQVWWVLVLRVSLMPGYHGALSSTDSRSYWLLVLVLSNSSYLTVWYVFWWWWMVLVLVGCCGLISGPALVLCDVYSSPYVLPVVISLNSWRVCPCDVFMQLEYTLKGFLENRPLVSLPHLQSVSGVFVL